MKNVVRHIMYVVVMLITLQLFWLHALQYDHASASYLEIVS